MILLLQFCDMYFQFVDALHILVSWAVPPLKYWKIQAVTQSWKEVLSKVCDAYLTDPTVVR